MKRRSGCVLNIFGLIFSMFVFGAVFTFGGLRDVLKTRESTAWPTVQGTITESYVRERRRSGDRDYFPEIRYRYVVNDQMYESDRVKFSFARNSGHSNARRVVNQYPVGQEVTVYYDPTMPETAVLETEVTSQTYGTLIGGIVAFVLFFLLLGRLFGLKGF